MPNRVLTDEEIWQAWKHGGGDAQDFARRIEAMVLERVGDKVREAYVVADKSVFEKWLDSLGRNKEVMPPDARDDLRLRNMPNPSASVMAALGVSGGGERLTLGKHEGAEDGMGGDKGGTTATGYDASESVRGIPSPVARMRSEQIRHPSDSPAQDEEITRLLKEHEELHALGNDCPRMVCRLASLARRLLKERQDANVCIARDCGKTAAYCEDCQMVARMQRDEARRLYEKLYELDWYKGYEPPWRPR